MLSILSTIFLLFLALILFVAAFFGSIVNYLLRVLFGIDLRGVKGAKPRNQSNTWTHTSSSSDQSSGATRASRSGNAHHEGSASAPRNGKIFASDEGEYVDFEEV